MPTKNELEQESCKRMGLLAVFGGSGIIWLAILVAVFL